MKDAYEKIISGVEIILPKETFRKKLDYSMANNKPLRIKLGFDPTAPDLHLGHFVVLKKLRDFQELGHEIHIIIGSFTAMIGDPTGKNKTRPPLTRQKVMENAKTYIDQLCRVLDVNNLTIHYNNDWFKDFSGGKIQELLSVYTINKLLTREDFSSRIDNNSEIHLHELLYPMLQGYDSMAIEADIEIGGTDQLFNMQVGRHIQEAYNLSAQHVICMPLLKGIDGVNKMSKSLGNYIGLLESSDSIMKKIQQVPETVLYEYVNLVTDFTTTQKIEAINRIGKDSDEVRRLVCESVVSQLINDKK